MPHDGTRRFRTALLLLAACLLVLAGIEVGAQTVDPARRLATLCEVWGLLKYYHPDVAMRADWDDVLIESLPRFTSADTRADLSAEVDALVRRADPTHGFRDADALGPRPLDPMFQWIRDRSAFEPATSLTLAAIVHSHIPGPNRFVTPVPNVRNADFSGDRGRADAPEYPDEATRLLALFRYWNMVQYFFPYRDVIGRDWHEVLRELIPKVAGARDALEYHRAISEATARVNDTHAVASSTLLESHYGLRSAPIQVRLVDGRTVVTHVYRDRLDRDIDLRVGDVVTHIGDVPVEARRAALRPLLSASNDAAHERVVHSRLLRTNEPRVALAVETAGGRRTTFDVNTVPLRDLTIAPGAVSAVLTGRIGYVHMGWLQPTDVGKVMTDLRHTTAIVFDVRNYPNGTMYQISPYLNPSTPFVKFTKPDYDHPGRLGWTTPLYSGAYSSAPFRYTGRVAILMNQETQSHAEFTIMALQTAPNALLVGSQTAGADGNISLITLPGGIRTWISGIGVFYPDGRPTQRIGIVPHVVVEPTIRGLREGRDEVLEEAVARLTTRR